MSGKRGVPGPIVLFLAVMLAAAVVLGFTTLVSTETVAWLIGAAIAGTTAGVALDWFLS